MKSLLFERSIQIGDCVLDAAIDLRNWKVGVYYEHSLRETHLQLGPAMVSFGRTIDTGQFLAGGSLFRWRRDRLEIRLDWSCHQLLFGYSCVGRRDHGIYLGPFDIQIEHSTFVVDDQVNSSPARAAANATERPGMPSPSLNEVITRWQQIRPNWFVLCRIDIDHGEFDHWAHYLDRAFADVGRILDRYPDFSFQITQIKEKLGSIRVYYRRRIDTDDPIDTAIEKVFEELRARSKDASRV